MWWYGLQEWGTDQSGHLAWAEGVPHSKEWYSAGGQAAADGRNCWGIFVLLQKRFHNKVNCLQTLLNSAVCPTTVNRHLLAPVVLHLRTMFDLLNINHWSDCKGHFYLYLPSISGTKSHQSSHWKRFTLTPLLKLSSTNRNRKFTLSSIWLRWKLYWSNQTRWCRQIFVVLWCHSKPLMLCQSLPVTCQQADEQHKQKVSTALTIPTCLIAADFGVQQTDWGSNM